MDFELRMAKEKLEKEQKAGKERARLKLQKEKKAKEDAMKQREAIEAVQRARRLDAIEAQLKAEEKMRDSTLTGRGIVFSRILEAIKFEGIGDKIKLPPSCFTELSDKGAFDKGPLYFHLSVVHQERSPELVTSDPKRTHCGVLEFTADEGSLSLPPHVWDNLFTINEFPTAPLVEVRYVWLSKGTYAKIQSDSVGFSDIPYLKAVLESRLRQHTTISEGDNLIIRHGILTYKLQVLELKPAPHVSILETDIEVDIVGPDPNSDTPSNFLKPLAFGVAESGLIEQGNYNYYKFSINQDIWSFISSGAANVEIKMDAESGDGDTDIYISKHPLLIPNGNRHHWSSYDVGSKVLILTSKDPKLESGSFSICVYGFKGTVKYTISVSIVDNDVKIGQQSGSSTVEIDTKMCNNCKRCIPSQSMVLHEAYCMRHNVSCSYPDCGVVLRVEEAKNHIHCDKCGVAFRGDEMEKHMIVFHKPIQCPCGVVLEKEQMDEHGWTSCPLRLITCKFCGDMVETEGSSIDLRDRLKGLTEHESKCGSRTARCDTCGRSVMLKDMEIHQVAVHQKS